MVLSYTALISNQFSNHTKKTIYPGEIISFYIDLTIGTNSIERYQKLSNGTIQHIDTLSTYNISHSPKEIAFIRNTFIKLDEIIDLDFTEMKHNNGSMLDIYHINYSSSFGNNVIGQAIPQETKAGAWWDIFWKNHPSEQDTNANLNTIIHELGHSLGLGHPFNSPFNKEWDSSDTIMSYNKSKNGWDTWFSNNDLNALISIWGRENDLNFINFGKNSIEYKYKRTSSNQLAIKTEIGYEDITNINTLNFKDKSLDVGKDIYGVFNLVSDIDSINGKIYRLYNAAFRRFPDLNGLGYWIEKNTLNIDSYRDTADSFLLSKEFKNLYPSELSNLEYINSLYNNILDRAPDINGSNYWLNQLEKGYEDKAELLMGFAESNENKSIFSIETGIY
tara:strand:- start:3199 stop:4371 length:1173 start_codon:yes stop_codon:yes gene_type:complete